MGGGRLLQGSSLSGVPVRGCPCLRRGRGARLECASSPSALFTPGYSISTLSLIPRCSVSLHGQLMGTTNCSSSGGARCRVENPVPGGSVRGRRNMARRRDSRRLGAYSQVPVRKLEGRSPRRLFCGFALYFNYAREHFGL